MSSAVERAFREESGRVLATLIRHLGGDFQLAEDALQDAFAVALATWPRDGVPDNPGAWITTAARRKAIDRLRRERALHDRLPTLHTLMELDRHEEGPEPEDETALGDDRLRLVFTCCHPALAMEARVALTLRTLGGLTTAEIARAFLVPEPTMAQRLVRAKRKIAAAAHPLQGARSTPRCPTAWTACSPSSTSSSTRATRASAGERLVRAELCAEAIRLGRLLARLMPDDAETAGLLALMLIHDARREARVAGDGSYVALPDQDRARWNADALAEGRAQLDRALRLRRAGPYQLQAAIASLHCEQEVDWPQIAALYRRLACMAPSPVVEVNRAVALGMAGSPHAGLVRPGRASTSIATSPSTWRTPSCCAAAATTDAADGAYARAIELSANAVERAELERRRGSLRTSDPRR